MRVAAVIDDRFPSVWTNTQQVAHTVSNLGALGVEVDLIVPRMADSLGMTPPERLDRICDFYGVQPTFGLRDILTFPADLIDVGWRPEKLTHGIAGPLYAVLRHYDVVYTRNILPMVIAASLGVPVVFETYRLLPRERYGAGVLFGALFRRLGPTPRLAGIVTHSELARRAFVEAGVPEEKTITIHNGIDPRMFEPRLSREEARERLGLDPHRPMVVYTGHMSEGKGVEMVVEIAALLPGVEFLLVGGPTDDDVQRIMDLAVRMGATNVHASGWVKPERLPIYLYAADVLIIPPSSEPLRRRGHTVLPIKVFTYLAAGRPIVAPDLPDTEEVLVHGENSLRVAPDDPRRAADAIASILDDPALAQGLAARALETSSRFTWRARAERLKRFMEERLGAS